MSPTTLRSFWLALSLVLAVGFVSNARAQSGAPRLAFAFSEGAGAITNDHSGNANVGALTGAVTFDTDGRVGGSAHFSGGAVDVPPSDSFALSSQFTVAAWVAPAGSSWQTIAARQTDDAAPLVGVYIAADYRPYVEAYVDGTLRWLWGATQLPHGEWSHVAAIYDGQSLRLIVNGRIDGSLAISGSLPPTTRSLQIGRDAGMNTFTGKIDEFHLFDIALSDADLAMVMNTPVDPSTPLMVMSATPAAGTVGVVSTPVTATFGRALDPSSVTSAAVNMVDGTGATTPVTVSYAATSRMVTVTPVLPLASHTTYTIAIAAGEVGVRDVDGNTLTSPYTWTFRTAGSSSLVGAWSFSEGTGSTSADRSGNENIATLKGDATWDAAGRIGGSLRLPGNGGVDIAATDSLSLTPAFTIAAWVAPEGSGWQPVLAQRASDLTPQIGLYIDAHYRPYVEARIDGTLRFLLGSSPLPAGEWSHLAATFDGQHLHLLVNGVVDQMLPAAGMMAPSTRTLQIGRDWGANVFSGRIDEVRIYNTALPATVVTQVMSAPLDAAAPLAVLRTTPLADAVGVVSTPISVTFNRSLDLASVGSGAVTLKDNKKTSLAVSVSYDDALRTLTITPTQALTPTTTYTVTVLGAGVGVRDVDGGTLEASVMWSFQTAADDVLVASWDFSEGSGIVAEDGTGNGNTGTLETGVTWIKLGRAGKGIQFNGTAGISIATTESLMLSDAFTIAAWVAPEGSNWQPIVTQRAVDLSPQIGIYVDANYQLYVEANIGGALRSLRAPVSLPAAKWAHVAASYDGSTLRLQIDGAVVASLPVTGALTPSAHPMQIGRDAAGNFFRGRVDEVEIYAAAVQCKGIRCSS